MALIIDANRSGDFNKPFKHHAAEIIRRITKRRLTIIVGGKLLEELALTHIRDLVVEWSRSGLLMKCDDFKVYIEETRFSDLSIKCDDPHVLALAFVSDCRLLYTDDKKLMADFKDLKLLKPRGKIFNTKTRHKIVLELLENFGK